MKSRSFQDLLSRRKLEQTGINRLNFDHESRNSLGVNSPCIPADIATADAPNMFSCRSEKLIAELATIIAKNLLPPDWMATPWQRMRPRV
jgi:hypothetical protein